MTGFDAFGQSLAEGLNWVAQMQGSERGAIFSGL